MTEEDDYGYTIDQILAPTKGLAAVSIAGASTTTIVPDSATEASLDRIHAFGLLEETFEGKSWDTVFPMIQSDEGTLTAITALPNYIGFIEVPDDVVLPMVVDITKPNGFRIFDLIKRHNARLSEGMEPAQVIRLVDKHGAEPEPEDEA